METDNMLELSLIVEEGQSQKSKSKDDLLNLIFCITLLLSSQDFSPEQPKNKNVL